MMKLNPFKKEQPIGGAKNLDNAITDVIVDISHDCDRAQEGFLSPEKIIAKITNWKCHCSNDSTWASLYDTSSFNFFQFSPKWKSDIIY